MFLWRLCYLLGGCSGTGYLRRTIFIVVVFWIKPPCFVCPTAGWRKLQIIYLHCNIFRSIWHFINRWIDTSAAAPFYMSDHFNQFSFSGGISKVRQSILQAIWFATVWENWKERNNRLFNDKVCSIIQVVEKIKILVYSWLKVKFVSLPFNYHGWWLSPFAILSIG